MLERIEQSFLDVVDIAPATVGRMDEHFHQQGTRQRTNTAGREERAYRLSECAPPATNERPCPHASPVVIDTWRIRQLELDHYDRFQGGLVLLAGGAAAGGG